MERELLTAEELAAASDKLNGWNVSMATLERRFEFNNFALALVFVNRVGAIAETLDHHPDIKLGWGFAEISTTTHDRGGVTGFDLELARRVSAIDVEMPPPG